MPLALLSVDYSALVPPPFIRLAKGHKSLTIVIDQLNDRQAPILSGFIIESIYDKFQG